MNEISLFSIMTFCNGDWSTIIKPQRCEHNPWTTRRVSKVTEIRKWI